MGPAVLRAAPSFTHEVMPLLSRAGCNMGACHGAGAGKGNLKLSLRGENPAADHGVLAGNLRGKRLNIDDPDASFILKKPAELTEHEGGKRFAPDSEEYRLLRDWIAAGAPMDPPDSPVLTSLTVQPPQAILTDPVREVQLAVTATFSDGTSRDVTRQVVYEPSNLLPKVTPGGVVQALKTGETTVVVRFEQFKTPVRLAFIPDRPDFVWAAPEPRNAVDEHVFDKLRRMRTVPSPECDDATFVRRVYLDLTGRIPSREEAESFTASTDSNKRNALVDRLLDSPGYADHWTMKWADLLRVEERILDTKGVAAFHDWIRQGVAADRPLDALAREVVTGLGSTYGNAPANFYRSLREPTQRAEAAAQVFLGTRLGCAKCHNHPFERWTQDDYYRFSAIFDRIGYTIIENNRKDENDKLEFVGEQVLYLTNQPELLDPRNKKAPAPALLGEAAALPVDTNHLASFADWMTRPEHPLFARVQVNRLWSHLMGTGLVDPIDDFRLTNPPSNPALLDALTDFFIGNGMRAKPLLRLICQSRTYQLSSTPLPGNAEDLVNHSHPIPRRLPAEPLLDAIHTALDRVPEFAAYPDTKTASAIPGVKLGGRKMPATENDRFLKQFGKSPRTTTCGCERSDESSLAQVFTLTSGPGVAGVISASDNRLATLTDSAMPPAEAITDLYWRTLSRPPTEAELQFLTPLLTENSTRRAALEDIVWSLINTKEFLLRH
ncbi:MAG: hypothetical protein JWL81_1472 [Verrucomicrobiales bacterium]|nr:hypothetical protein [Verrucomicrobiales bacterium]